MANIYGVYKKARNASWQALIDNQVDRLPVDIVQIIHRNGIKLLKNSQAHELKCGEAGISVFDGEQWFIVYDDLVPLGRKRFTIAHELGHIFLGHPLVSGLHTRINSGELSQIESEANIFASRFLAPACVLWGLNVHDSADISRICEISAEAAEIRAKRMAELYKRNMFLSHPLERKVYNAFQPWIIQQKYPK